MGLSSRAIQEFKEIYRKEYGITLSDGEAGLKGAKLLELFKVIARPIPEDKPE